MNYLELKADNRKLNHQSGGGSRRNDEAEIPTSQVLVRHQRSVQPRMSALRFPRLRADVG